MKKEFSFDRAMIAEAAGVSVDAVRFEERKGTFGTLYGLCSWVIGKRLLSGDLPIVDSVCGDVIDSSSVCSKDCAAPGSEKNSPSAGVVASGVEDLIDSGAIKKGLEQPEKHDTGDSSIAADPDGFGKEPEWGEFEEAAMSVMMGRPFNQTRKQAEKNVLAAREQLCVKYVQQEHREELGW